MKRIVLVTTFLLFQLLSFVYLPSVAHAETRTVFTEARCTKIGQCVDNKTCVVNQRVQLSETVTVLYVGLSAEANCGSSAIGSVSVPNSITILNQRAQLSGNQRNSNSIGIVIFASNLLRLFAIIAGIWAMINFVIGGYTLITSGGDAGAMGKVKEQITMSVIGLSLIAGAYIIAGLIGLFFFGDASFILNPKLEGAV